MAPKDQHNDSKTVLSPARQALNYKEEACQLVQEGKSPTATTFMANVVDETDCAQFLEALKTYVKSHSPLHLTPRMNRLRKLYSLFDTLVSQNKGLQFPAETSTPIRINVPSDDLRSRQLNASRKALEEFQVKFLQKMTTQSGDAYVIGVDSVGNLFFWIDGYDQPSCYPRVKNLSELQDRGVSLLPMTEDYALPDHLMPLLELYTIASLPRDIKKIAGAVAHDGKAPLDDSDVTPIIIETRSKSNIPLKLNVSPTALEKFQVQFLQKMTSHRGNGYVIGVCEKGELWFWLDRDLGCSFWKGSDNYNALRVAGISLLPMTEDYALPEHLMPLLKQYTVASLPSSTDLLIDLREDGFTDSYNTGSQTQFAPTEARAPEVKSPSRNPTLAEMQEEIQRSMFPALTMLRLNDSYTLDAQQRVTLGQQIIQRQTRAGAKVAVTGPAVTAALTIKNAPDVPKTPLPMTAKTTEDGSSEEANLDCLQASMA